MVPPPGDTRAPPGAGMRRWARLSAAISSSDELFIEIAWPCADERRSEGSTDDAGAKALAPMASAARITERRYMLLLCGRLRGFPFARRWDQPDLRLLL